MTSVDGKRLTFSSTKRLRQVEKPSNQNVSFLLMMTFKKPFLVHLSRLRVRRQKSASGQNDDYPDKGEHIL